MLYSRNPIRYQNKFPFGTKTSTVRYSLRQRHILSCEDMPLALGRTPRRRRRRRHRRVRRVGYAARNVTERRPGGAVEPKGGERDARHALKTDGTRGLFG